MFDTLKIYTRKQIPLDDVIAGLVRLGYKRAGEVLEEGDFSLRGDTLELFPVNFNFPLRLEWEYDTVGRIYTYDKNLHKKISDYDFIIVIPHSAKIRKYSSDDLPLEAVLRIKKGDYVVHTRHGIGRFRGMVQLTVRDKQDFYFEIEYADRDKLYVSREEAHLVQRYLSFGAKPPKLNKLGSKEWLRTKERVEHGIKALAIELLQMDAQRKINPRPPFCADGEWQKLFEESFPYKATDDQLKAAADVKADMTSVGSMDRIICGDVGYGKTEVAMRAAIKAVESSRQVAILVPTTILAYQHYLTLSRRLQQFPIRVEMISRFRTPAEQTQIIKELAAGKIDIIVGTHRMLSDDVAFRDLGLLIIDEEHKFGVRHKEYLKRLKVGVDILTMTATPIPRTLYMGLVGIKNISQIKTPPAERLGVHTKLLKFSPELIRDAVVKEVERGGEVFIVHNRIETIYKLERLLRKLLPAKVTIGLIHGRLPSREIEDAMMAFIDKKINCLISTAIVESGIDIPSANTIIINDAHMFGLADLHQLRGRVGRFNVQAYAYLVVPSRVQVSSEAAKRLELIEEYSHLGAGFDLAMSDLELRGAGNILGKEQHGFVWMVGFDLYCRLLKKEVEYLKEAFKIEK